jgi:hypothetical protein
MAKEEIVDAATEHPRIVLEERASCPDSHGAAAVFEAALAATRTPGAGWRVRLLVEEAPKAHALHAEGDIVNADGLVVARRSLAGAAGDCEGLARAMGVWASLVLDQEVSRGENAGPLPSAPPGTADAGTAGTSPAADAPGSLNAFAPAASGAGEASPSSDPRAHGAADTPDTATGAKVDAAATADSDAGTRKRAANQSFELGLGTFLMAGTGANAVMGGTPYAVVEASPGFFLRPALAAGESLTALGGSGNATALFVAGRIDACTRLPGNYTQNRGLELTMCGGADFGATYFPASPPGYGGLGAPRSNTMLPQVSIGPSLDLRGELASHWSVVLRGVSGVNVVRNGFSDRFGNRFTPDWVAGRLELALAWRIR